MGRLDSGTSGVLLTKRVGQLPPAGSLERCELVARLQPDDAWLERVDFAGYLVATAYNLVRLARLTPVPALT